MSNQQQKSQAMSNDRKLRKRKTERFETSFIQAFKIEIAIGVMFLLGVFLLVEDMSIKLVMYNGISAIFQGIAQIYDLMVQGLFDTIIGFEASDIVGNLLVLTAVFLLILRIRSKAIERYHDLSVCPDCEEELKMVHRNNFQRIITKIFRLKIRRYRCKSCGYEGLRIRPLSSK